MFVRLQRTKTPANSVFIKLWLDVKHSAINRYFASVVNWTWRFQLPQLHKHFNVVGNFRFLQLLHLIIVRRKASAIYFQGSHSSFNFLFSSIGVSGRPNSVGQTKIVSVTSLLQKQKSVHTTRGLAKCLATECVFQLFVLCFIFSSRVTEYYWAKKYILNL